MKQIIVLQKNKNQFVSRMNNFTNQFFCLFKDNLEHFDTSDLDKSVPFDEQLIDKLQFSSLVISFSGLKKNEMVISTLIDFFRTNYKETDEEKTGKKTLVSYLSSLFLILGIILNSYNNVLLMHNDVHKVIYSLKN